MLWPWSAGRGRTMRFPDGVDRANHDQAQISPLGRRSGARLRPDLGHRRGDREEFRLYGCGRGPIQEPARDRPRAGGAVRRSVEARRLCRARALPARSPFQSAFSFARSPCGGGRGRLVERRRRHAGFQKGAAGDGRLLCAASGWRRALGRRRRRGGRHPDHWRRAGGDGAGGAPGAPQGYWPKPK